MSGRGSKHGPRGPYRKRSSVAAPGMPLTLAEIRLLQKLCRGLTCKDIVQTTGVQKCSVYSVYRTLQIKAGTTSAAQLGAWGALMGYVNPQTGASQSAVAVATDHCNGAP